LRILDSSNVIYTWGNYIRKNSFIWTDHLLPNKF
jgi:hypothetical protein